MKSLAAKSDSHKSMERIEEKFPSIEKQITKAKEGSSQKTLNECRLTALKLAIESLENRRVTVSEIGSFTVYNYKKRNGVKER
ncbi:hypothetical protein ACPVTF_09575 [Geobacillus icigianus]|uniref:Uncharacterized protein n=1 Tax=Geobacillus subterraneus TaxID=129338 RepID=A0A679FK61_9BACL|nr:MULTISPECIES: hypothetical protein [Geobacillus]KYD30880.1 hypothetical protein B4113_2727 [Geobacillus sp. B4113_201601]BBW96180.1 hypothetical protein GsuE55_10130 [Geobacillus subterraneus]